MKRAFSTKRLCRAGVIAALYVAITYAFMPFAYGPFQFRPAEALCILPLFFPEAVPALFIGCAIANIPSGLYDVAIGSFTTLFAALGTFYAGKFFKSDRLRILIGGFFPVLLNAVFIPLLIVFLYGDTMGFESTAIAYFCFLGAIFLTQSISIYGIGTPLYFGMKKTLKRER